MCLLNKSYFKVFSNASRLHSLLYLRQAFDPTILGTLSRIKYTEQVLTLQQKEKGEGKNWIPL